MTLYGKKAVQVGYVLGAAALLALIACLFTTFLGESIAEMSCSQAYQIDQKDTKDQPAPAKDADFRIRILNASSEARLSGHLCLVLSGVAKAPEAAKAGTDAGRPGDVEIALFLNDQRVPKPTDASGTSRPFTARAIPEAQLLIYEFGQTANATSDAAKFWRGLLAGKTDHGKMTLRVGASRSQASSPETFAATEATLLVWSLKPLVFGGLAVLLLIAAFVVFAANSTVLRDSALTLGNVQDLAVKAEAEAKAAPQGDPELTRKATNARATVNDLEKRCGTDPRTPVAPFSLGRSQMALWLMLSTAGFLFLWLTLGFYLNVITTAILVLLGISVSTGLAAIVIDQAPAPQPASPPVSKNFLADITSDAGGAKLQRIQVVIWTCILAIIFVWNSVWNFVFVDFDVNLLLLMGIANSTYLGFKPSET